MVGSSKASRSLTDQSRWNDEQGAKRLVELEMSRKFDVWFDSLPLRKRLFVDAIGDVAGKRVLEFGSGRGEISVVLAQRGATCVGVDVGPDLVQLGQSVANVNDVGDKCSFVCASIDDLSALESNEFDLVVGFAILHHVSEDGVKRALAEAHRVLRAPGRAMFLEPVEDSKTFELLQDVVPAGKRGTSTYRPSRLNRKAWADFMERSDDRAMTTAEFKSAQGSFRAVSFDYDGMLARITRIIPSKSLGRILDRVDTVLTHPKSPLKRFSRSVIVTFSK